MKRLFTFTLILTITTVFLFAGGEAPSPVNWKDYILPVTAVISAATAITAVTPTTVDNKIINFILGILNFVSGNFLKNKNKDA